MTAVPEITTVRCESCGSSFSIGAKATLSPVKCWRSDCPGGKPDAPRNRLRAVK